MYPLAAEPRLHLYGVALSYRIEELAKSQSLLTGQALPHAGITSGLTRPTGISTLSNGGTGLAAAHGNEQYLDSVGAL
jgi:hypothetical protein